MTASRKSLTIGGLLLALWGMLWGLVYAVFFEHQILDGIGGAITQAFMRAAERNLPAAREALAHYAHLQFRYVRQVDVHSHWIGLAMLLIILGIVFERVSFAERTRRLVALTLVVGATIFPLGVILQTVVAGPLGSALAVAGSAMVILGLAASAVGLARAPA